MNKYDEFKGNKLIVLMKDEEDKYPFKFGKAKAKLIMDNLDAVKAFAEEEQSGEQEKLEGQ